MSDPLGTYLHDHLAGAAYAIDLVEFMRDQHQGEELGEFAAGLLGDIKADREILRQLAERVGAGSNKLKELTAWLGEKVSRLKLSHGDEDDIGTFEALEFLEIGIHGKLELWRALGAIARSEPRLREMDFGQLAARAESQRVKVENRRLQAAKVVFRSVGAGTRSYMEKLRSNERFSREGASRSIGKTTAGGALLALAVLGAIALAPDVARYMKIRAM